MEWISLPGILVHGMLFKLELKKCLATIKRAGNKQQCILRTPTGEADTFSGVSEDPDEICLYFAQVNHNNDEISTTPSLVEAIKIIVCPLRDDGTVEETFLEQCRDKGSTIVLPSGKEYGIKLARITIPDGITPIVARLSLGG